MFDIGFAFGYRCCIGCNQNHFFTELVIFSRLFCSLIIIGLDICEFVGCLHSGQQPTRQAALCQPVILSASHDPAPSNRPRYVHDRYKCPRIRFRSEDLHENRTNSILSGASSRSASLAGSGGALGGSGWLWARPGQP